ncbi:MAG TPA: MFS transporter [Acidimicrobiia bacterium]|jgi:MFS family permease|nr:MFS transporter [Acidimicrobiia bacterium]
MAEPTTPLTAESTRLLTPRFLIVVTSGLFYFLAVSMMVPVLPHYVKHSLGDGSVAVGATVLAFAFGAITLRLYAGRLGERLGRRVLIIGGALVVAGSTLAYGVVHALWWIIMMRVVSGFGEAVFFVGAATMITDLSPPERRGEAISYWSVAVYGGFAFGPVIGDALRGASRYQLTFAVSAALALIAAVVGCFTVDPPRVESDAPDHLIARGALLPGTVLFLGLIPLAGFGAFMPLYATDQLGIRSGPVFLLYGILILVVRIFGARIPDRLGGRNSATIALVLAAVGIGLVAAWPTVAGLVAGTIILAGGMSLMYPALFVLALEGVSDAERASVVATISSFFDASQGVGAFICGAVVAVSSNSGAFTTGVVAAVLGLLLLRFGTPSIPR